MFGVRPVDCNGLVNDVSLHGHVNSVDGEDMVSIEPIRVQVEREEDGRTLASVPDLPGVMAYAATPEEAVRKVKAIALQVLADMIESGEDLPAPLNVLFAS